MWTYFKTSVNRSSEKYLTKLYQLILKRTKTIFFKIPVDVILKIFTSYSFKSYENLFDKGKRATAFTIPVSRTHFTGCSCKVLIFI